MIAPRGAARPILHVDWLVNLLLFLAIIGWAVVLVLAQASGRLAIGPAVILLAAPVLAFGVMLRPAWVVLFVAAAPLAQIQIAPTRGLVVLMLVTLLGQLAMRGRLSLGWRSGFLGMSLILGAALTLRADLSATDALIARGFLNSFAFYILLGIVCYNVTRAGDLHGRQLLNALLVGLATSVVLEFTGLSGRIPGALPIGRPVSYLAAIGLSLCFARLADRDESGARYHPLLHVALGCGFLLAMFPGLQRGAWLSALISVVYIALRTRKTQYLYLAFLGLVVIFALPVARERVVPSSDLSSGGGYTTGRVDLWVELWDEIEPALPLGNGFGHTFTLSSEDLFGEGITSFNPEGKSTFVYPHNDFLFWMVELGMIGLLGMLLFWTQLLRALRFVMRSRTPGTSYIAAMSCIVITGFIVQLVGSAFFFPALASILSIAAGAIFGAREAIARGGFLDSSP